MVKVYDRKKKKYVMEEHQGEGPLNFLYNNFLGRFFLKLIFINKIFSRIAAKYYESKLSVKLIDKFIKKNKIDMNLYENKVYNSFNDFFTRKRKPELLNFAFKNNELISPADARLQIYKANKESIKIKDSIYDLEEILLDEKLAKEFVDGYVLVFRLAVDNYHRYCHIDDGKIITKKVINGKLHTVASISRRYKIYKENQREYAYIDGKNIGKYIQMEVGAMLIGKIINNDKQPIKGQEKGFFAYGGSTIVVILKDNVKIDKDILKNSENEIETKVSYGEKIGNILRRSKSKGND